MIGASMRGLVTTYLLSQLGHRAVLVERGARVGGVDGSFTTALGNRFDHGLHVLDQDRSELATRLFTHVVGGAVHAVPLARAIVLRGHLLPYAPRPAELPPELRALLPGDELVDDLGDAPPTRERLARCYGRGFADLIFDEVLPSYPCENRHRAFGVAEERLLTNVYPWLFPRARFAQRAGDESRTFHDRLRAGVEQVVLYPRSGGFGGFVAGFLRTFDASRIEVLTGADDLHLELDRATQRVAWVGARGRRFQARHYFWTAAWPELCRRVGLPCQDVATDRVLLGSFRLAKRVEVPYQEILVGDPRFRINRISFPARFRESDEPLLQVEFAVPIAESWPTDAAAWREIWQGDLRRLGLLGADHAVEDWDFRSFAMHYNGFGMEGVPLRDADPSQLHPASNLRPVAPSMANWNLNRHVPRALAYVARVLAQGAE